MLNIAFPELEEEMKAQNLSVRSMLMKTDLKYSTTIIKLRTGRNVTVDDAVAIKKATNSEKPIEVLFSKSRRALA